MIRRVWFIVILFSLSGCPGIVPKSGLYVPATADERELFATAARNIFPDDVRGNPAKYKATLIAWPGILKKAQWLPEAKSTAEFVVEHHYWDWIEDHSIQRAVAFLSPRGEGELICQKQSKQDRATLPAVDSVAIIYGYPLEIEPGTNRILLDCKMISFASRNWYATDIWDYGRNYLLKGDRSDFKVLRVPLR